MVDVAASAATTAVVEAVATPDLDCITSDSAVDAATIMVLLSAIATAATTGLCLPATAASAVGPAATVSLIVVAVLTRMGSACCSRKAALTPGLDKVTGCCSDKGTATICAGVAVAVTIASDKLGPDPRTGSCWGSSWGGS